MNLKRLLQRLEQINNISCKEIEKLFNDKKIAYESVTVVKDNEHLIHIEIVKNNNVYKLIFLPALNQYILFTGVTSYTINSIDEILNYL